jgi:septum formation protein
VTPAVDETPARREPPRTYALRVASAKARAVPPEPGTLVLAADTVVALGRRILPKAESDAEVARCLSLLSGRRHTVFTAIALAQGEGPLRTRVVATRVGVKRLTAEEIAGYCASGEGLGKAGGYAIQGRAEAFVRQINGSYSNVVGLPLYETLTLLDGASYRPGER